MVAERGKEDFNGVIDGLGYKKSMDDPAKPPLDLVPPTFVWGIGQVLGKGASKYARGNWMRGMSFSEVLAAAERHIQAAKYKDLDDGPGGTGLDHVYLAGCELAFLSWFKDGPRAAEYARFDDRIFTKSHVLDAQALVTKEMLSSLAHAGVLGGVHRV